jgi:hypothetical protein
MASILSSFEDAGTGGILSFSIIEAQGSSLAAFKAITGDMQLPYHLFFTRLRASSVVAFTENATGVRSCSASQFTIRVQLLSRSILAQFHLLIFVTVRPVVRSGLANSS